MILIQFCNNKDSLNIEISFVFFSNQSLKFNHISSTLSSLNIEQIKIITKNNKKQELVDLGFKSKLHKNHKFKIYW